ncbi:hypothetical protein HYPSUDRAFT_40657 [Hypholoma sublateritium FD-334 SS-4]|uniref:GPI ethanolamine phosphate transferase 1 n=1 Tax=Hypholoma sublateritium (strain FD-334 SS-4) TaxID=945553 RepID=A0A0D2PT02_HYPSF|nr:hypothetical protein HYPSUDRAFT_40657 [Hypholoma sublateritium FD-334 SS-4]
MISTTLSANACVVANLIRLKPQVQQRLASNGEQFCKLSTMAKPTLPTPLPKTRYNPSKVLLIGLVFHVIFMGSVFDAYFTRPVLHGMRRYGDRKSGNAPAKRLVFIVGDGLRADLLFSENAFVGIPGAPRHVAPHLRSIAEMRGVFGISHTRVPTESRPCHVALIGGMYEYVSSVLLGWKTNPAEFDSVFNQSKTTFSFGSPDILPLFSRSASPGVVRTWSYEENDIDYTKDATSLDLWTLNNFRRLFENATTDPILASELRQDKVVFFLHLLGPDTTAHSYRCHSKEYMRNLQVVDGIVREAESLVNDFYDDNATSFIFTADHGASAVGNHGDGHPDNTRTPLIAWGSGVRGPLLDESFSSHDEYSKPWGLGHLVRRDVQQADIAPIMAALIGIDWPVNSVGVLPDVDPSLPGYLDWNTEQDVARVALVNAQVILEQYRVMHEIRKKRSLFYAPYPPLVNITRTDQNSGIILIENSISEQRWDDSRHLSSQLIQQSLDGLHYLQTYDRRFIRGFAMAGYLGLMAYTSLFVFRPVDAVLPARVNNSYLVSFVFTAMSWTIMTVFVAIFALQKSPWSFYAYALFPCYFWQQFWVQMVPFIRQNKSKLSIGKCTKYLGKCATLILGLLIMTAGYTYRLIWSAGFLFMGLVWPFFWEKGTYSQSPTIVASWALSCVASAVFPALPVEVNESLSTIILGGLVILSTGFASAVYVLRSRELQSKPSIFTLFVVQGFLIIATMIITVSSTLSLQAKQGLPTLYKWSGWIVLVISSTLPFWTKSGLHTKHSKILMYFLACAPCFIILSIGAESLFFVSYSITLISWVQVESLVRSFQSSDKVSVWSRDSKHRKYSSTRSGSNEIQMSDLRIALYFLFFVQVGFFGPGNVASITSFYLEPIFRLVPIFDPPLLLILLVFRIIAPYIMLSVVFASLNYTLGLPPHSLLLIALSMADVMTLVFFLNVNDTAAWSDIGQSVACFCISSLLLIWSAGICAGGARSMADVHLSRSALHSTQKTE